MINYLFYRVKHFFCDKKILIRIKFQFTKTGIIFGIISKVLMVIWSPVEKILTSFPTLLLGLNFFILIQYRNTLNVCAQMMMEISINIKFIIIFNSIELNFLLRNSFPVLLIAPSLVNMKKSR